MTILKMAYLTILLAVFFLNGALLANSKEVTFCFNSTSKSLPRNSTSKPLPRVKCSPGRTLLIDSAQVQATTNCTHTPKAGNWTEQGKAVFEIFNVCNLREGSCLPLQLPNSYFMKISFTCERITDITKLDLCSKISKNASAPFYLQSPYYPKLLKYRKSTKCDCFLQHENDTFTVIVQQMTSSLAFMTLRSGPTKRVAYNGQTNVKMVDVGRVNLTFDSPDFPPGVASFWIKILSIKNISISITCNDHLTTTQVPATTMSMSSIGSSTVSSTSSESTLPGTPTSTTSPQNGSTTSTLPPTKGSSTTRPSNTTTTTHNIESTTGTSFSTRKSTLFSTSVSTTSGDFTTSRSTTSTVSTTGQSTKSIGSTGLNTKTYSSTTGEGTVGESTTSIDSTTNTESSPSTAVTSTSGDTTAVSSTSGDTTAVSSTSGDTTAVPSTSGDTTAVSSTSDAITTNVRSPSQSSTVPDPGSKSTTDRSATKGTHGPTSPTTTATTPAELDPQVLMIIYIVVPTVVVCIIIIIVVVIVLKCRHHTNRKHTEDQEKFRTREFSPESLYAKENYAMDMMDNDLYASEDDAKNGQINAISSYGVGVAFETFRGEEKKARQLSDSDPSLQYSDVSLGSKDRWRAMLSLPSSETFGGVDLLTSASNTPNIQRKVDADVYAEVDMMKKRKCRGQVDGEGHLEKEHECTDGEVMQVEGAIGGDGLVTLNSSDNADVIYSLANDDVPLYFEYDSGSRPKDNDLDSAGPEYQYAYAKTRRSRSREPRQSSVHIYDDVPEDADSDGTTHSQNNGVKASRPDASKDGGYDSLDYYPSPRRQRKGIEKIVNYQRTEL